MMKNYKHHIQLTANSSESKKSDNEYNFLFYIIILLYLKLETEALSQMHEFLAKTTTKFNEIKSEENLNNKVGLVTQIYLHYLISYTKHQIVKNTMTDNIDQGKLSKLTQSFIKREKDHDHIKARIIEAMSFKMEFL